MSPQPSIVAPATAPWVARIPLSPDRGLHTLVIVPAAGQAISPPEGLQTVVGFHADGQGGWVSAAQAGDGGWGYIDGAGRWRVPPTLEDARGFSKDGMARFMAQGLWGFVNLAGEVVVPPRFEDTQPFRGGLSAALVGKNAWRIIDHEGRFACEAGFPALSEFGACGLACAMQQSPKKNERLHGFVDRDGRWVIEPRFQSAEPFEDLDVTPASLDGKRWGLIDTRGQWVVEPRYAGIDAFNSEGLAYYREPGRGDQACGYLDARGQVVARGSEQLSRRMACGLAASDTDRTRFLRADGNPLETPDLSYGTHFREAGGFALVRTQGSSSEGGAGAGATWGLLRTDGRVVACDALLEPLTDGKGWMLEEQPGTPLAPFLTRDGQVVWVDKDCAVVWRAVYDGRQVALQDAGGAVLWRSGLLDDSGPVQPFFHPLAAGQLRGMAAPDEDIVPVAQALLAEAEARLHGLAAGEALDDCHGPDDDEVDDDDEDESAALARRAVRAQRVVRVYLGEEHQEHYEFLGRQWVGAVGETHGAMLQALTGRYGPPDLDPEHKVPWWFPSGHLPPAWPVPMDRALPGDSGVLRESRAQWLSLYKIYDSGDGDAWWELWLMAAPSLDALETVQRARRRALPGGGGPDLPADDAVLVEQLRSAALTLADIPRERMTHVMVAAGLANDERTVRFVPRRLMTPERYAIALGRKAKRFEQIPPGMLSEAACIEAVRHAGWNLGKVPDALRTLTVCAFAVSHSSGAMEHVPEALRDRVPGAIRKLPRKDS